MELIVAIASLASGGTSAAAALSSLFDNPLFTHWQNAVFEKRSWEGIMCFVRITLTLGGALLLLYEMRARRLGQPVSKRTVKQVALIMTVLGFLTYFDFFNPNTRYVHYYHRHEFYHYYLGAKYSDELGYTRLYDCTAVAEAELGHNMTKREIRDLRVNLIKPANEISALQNPEECKQHFDTETWAAFKKDINWFYNSARGSYWEGMQKDHGYNPPPVWTMTGKAFAAIAPAGDGFFKALAGLDVLFHVGLIAMVGWAFGWKIMAIATVFWGCNAPANFYWTGGAFLRQDWIFFLIASACFARKRKFALAGASLTWSALLRVFPLIFFAGWGIIAGLHVVKKLRARKARATKRKTRGKSPGLLSLIHPDHRQLIGGCIVAAGILIPASVVATGPDSYKEFVEHISVHKDTPLTNHMGLETILTHTWDGRMRFTRNDTLDDPFQLWKEGRVNRARSLRWLQLSIAVGLGVWMIWALRRTKLLWVGQALGLALCVSLTNLTCYYYSMFLLAALLVKVRPGLGPTVLATSGASYILLWHSNNTGFYYVDDRYTAQAYLFFFFGLLLLYAYSRPFSLERLKAWWNRQPEPKKQASEELSPALPPHAA